MQFARMYTCIRVKNACENLINVISPYIRYIDLITRVIMIDLIAIVTR